MSAPEQEIAQLQAAIAALEAQRSLLGDAVVDTGTAPMRNRLAILQAQLQPVQQRKLATVLFADVSGFTALSETRDAEVMAEIMNDLWALVDRAILDHGGRIDKHIGDAVMALWGADTAREDDPERAVRAALAMQAAVASFRASHHVPMALRIGVNTGPVVLGAMGTTAEFTAIGDAVNLASRLEHAAPVDGILISHDTYRQVRGVFDVRPREPITVKGKAEPVQTYVVTRAKPRAFRMATRGVEGVETRMIGRDAELERLQALFLEARAGRAPQLVTVVGEAGLGKSRLIYEFANWLDLRPETTYYFKGRATQDRRHVLNSLFHDMFAHRFDILDSDSAAAVLDKFRAGTAGILEATEADVAGHYLGFDLSTSSAVGLLLGSAEFGQVARAHLARYFRALAALSPVVILLEDIHWADDQSLELAAYLAALPPTRLLLVAAMRPELLERRPDWGAPPSQRITLTPLSKQDGSALVGEILRRVKGPSGSLREMIVDAAEGNPFYAEEMVKTLMEQGVIERGIRNEERGSEGDQIPPLPGSPASDEVWRVRTDRLAGLSAPPTLTGLLQARIDRLPPVEREALQQAAVIGRVFWDDAVAALTGSNRAEIEPILESSRKRELVARRERSSFAGAGEYIFHHALLREVAYEMVLLKHRTTLHGRAARWLESHAGERLDEYLTLIAEHYIQAGEQLRAAVHLEHAGAAAFEKGAFQPARQSLERALALREASGETSGPVVTTLSLSLGQACSRLDDYSAAETALARALAGGREAEDTYVKAEALIWLAHVALLRGEFTRAQTLIDEALPLARAAGGRTPALALIRGAVTIWKLGNLEAAEAMAAEALAATRAAEDFILEIDALTLLSNIASDRRQLERAVRLCEEALGLARAARHLSHEARATMNLGNMAYLQGDFAAAREYGQKGLAFSHELGEPEGIITSLGNLAQATLQLGDVGAARAGVREAMALAQKLGGMSSILWLVTLYAQIVSAEGDVGRALTLYGLALDHPAQDYQTVLEIEEELARLDLSAAEVQAGLAAGTALDLQTVVEEILDGKW